ncbi:uncharacterized protein TRAVEDRAFT_50248 [Trametes versicolor FP-101664 SS1]|uniref:uncharacterized protein n=1 Tax=Trametes versicolor (strain FP-101664) TaxID=717944 RepID=UPI0004624229|nr:uncharacterized protein TRAVEDRAFT_50248 [Trametes versicolor FP-101664 SS1]EIW55768.1 hypothetical protein TRAVEDRAFT_50248 [Trametes versicolor FP-101664 SS1]
MSLSRRTIASLAQTSTWLHAASIHALWEDQESLVPLLRLLPPDSWTEVPLVDGGSTFHIIRPDQLEWTRFNHYAKHVQRIYWEELRDVSLRALTTLSGYCPAGQPLLPQLRELTWDEPCADYSPSVYLFLAPNLKRLELTLSHLDPPTIMALFQHVEAACKRVDHLTMGTDPVCDEMWELTGVVGYAFARLLRGLPELKHVKIEGLLSTSCVEALAELPKLVMLELRAQPVEMCMIASSAVWGSRHGEWFNTLEELKFYVDQMDSSTVTFLGAVQSANLQKLRIESHYQSYTHMVKVHLDAFAHATYRDSLTSLTLNFDRQRNETTPSPRIETTPCPALDVEETLEPFYACPHIDTLHIRSPSLVASTNALQNIAHAWRNLATLSLVSFQPPPWVKPRLTLEGLIPLARDCPDLCTLELPVSADRVPDEATLARLLPVPSRCALRRLVVFDATIEDEHAVADFLARLFPEIRWLESGSTPGGAQWLYTYEMHYRWTTVRTLLTGQGDAPVQWPDSGSDSE